LEEDEEGEEEDPEETHGVPVPGGAIDEDLPGFKLARLVEADERNGESCDAEEEVDSVGVGDEEEEVAAGIGAEEDVFRGELAPADPLTGEEEEA